MWGPYGKETGWAGQRESTSSRGELRTAVAGAVFTKGLEGLELSKWLLGPGAEMWRVGHVNLPDLWTSSQALPGRLSECKPAPRRGWRLEPASEGACLRALLS